MKISYNPLVFSFQILIMLYIVICVGRYFQRLLRLFFVIKPVLKKLDTPIRVDINFLKFGQEYIVSINYKGRKIDFMAVDLTSLSGLSARIELKRKGSWIRPETKSYGGKNFRIDYNGISTGVGVPAIRAKDREEWAKNREEWITMARRGKNREELEADLDALCSAADKWERGE